MRVPSLFVKRNIVPVYRVKRDKKRMKEWIKAPSLFAKRDNVPVYRVKRDKEWMKVVMRVPFHPA